MANQESKRLVISLSGKRRYPASYTRNGKEVHYYVGSRKFRMVVVQEPARYKKKNGKPALTSTTKHEIID